jgi:hypothetical protein
MDRVGRRSNDLGERAEVLSGGSEVELVAGAVRAMQLEAVEPQDALKVGEQHLDLLALAARSEPLVVHGAGWYDGPASPAAASVRSAPAPMAELMAPVVNAEPARPSHLVGSFLAKISNIVEHTMSL